MRLMILAMLALAGAARAEMSEIVAAKQYGVATLPMMVMERFDLADKHAKAAGLPGLRVGVAPGGRAERDERRADLGRAAVLPRRGRRR